MKRKNRPYFEQFSSIRVQYKLIVKFSNCRIKYLLVFYICNVFLSLMKKNYLCHLIIALFTLLLPVMAMACPKSADVAIDVEHIVTISQNCALPQDFDLSDTNDSNSEVQIRILRDEISAPIKTVLSSMYIEIHIFSKNIHPYFITSAQQKLIPFHHSSILFTGALRI